MIIDTHTHSSNISKCSIMTYQELIDFEKSQGYDGFVLTNHCQPWYYAENEHQYKIKAYVEEFENAYEYGKSRNFKVFLGIEATCEGSDYLLFGLNKKMLLESPCFYALNQEELFNYATKNNLFLVHAHPYRWGGLRNPKQMHAVEINYNSTYNPEREKVEKFAKDNGLQLTIGTDLHGTKDFVFAGIEIDDSIENAEQLRDALFAKKYKLVYPK